MIRELRSSPFCGPHLVYPTPAASPRPPKFDPNKIEVVCLRCSSGKISVTGTLALPQSFPWICLQGGGGDDTAKTTGEVGSTVKLIQNRQFALEWHSLPLSEHQAFKDHPEMKKKKQKKLSSMEIRFLMRLQILPD